MTPILEHLLEATIVLAAGLAATALARRRSAALGHVILASSLLAVPLIPATGLISPSWTIPAIDGWLSNEGGNASTLRWLREPVALSPAAAGVPAPAASAATPLLTPIALLAAVWLAGVTAGLLHLFVGMRRLWAFAADTVPADAAWTAAARELAQRFGISRAVELRQSDNPTLLVTWGLWRPRVVVPAAAAEWPADRIRSVLAHELAHVRRGDWAVQVAAELVRIVYWFHPLTWIACRRLRDESEHACDDSVIESGVAAQDYATHLFEVARTFAVHPHRWIPAAAIARPSTLERRIAAMLNADRNRRPARRWAPLAAIVSMGSVAVISAGFDPDAIDPVRLSTDVQLTASPAVAVGLPETPRANAPAPATPVAAPAPAAPQASAPAGTAVVFGRIIDQSGAVLPGVEVSVTPSGAAEGRRVVTDASGFYQMPRLSAGDYVVQTALPGFTATRAVVTVSEAGSVEHSLQLDLGSLEETITVTGTRGSFRPPRDPAVRTAPAPRQAAAPKILKDAAAPSAAPGSPVRVGGAIKAPAKVLDVRPVYPAAAQAAGVEGIVALDAVIGTNGSVKTVEVRRNSEPDLTSAAVEAVKGWKFTPTLLNGQPVDVQMAVTINFTLQ